MKRFAVFITMLVFASLACQTVLGGGDEGVQPLVPDDILTEESPELPVQEDPSGGESTDDGATDSGESGDYPLPDDATNVFDMAGTINFQTSLSLEDVIKFYRDAYAAEGYTEREINTAITDTTFNLIFDGDPSGMAIVVQGVNLGDGTTNVTITLVDM